MKTKMRIFKAKLSRFLRLTKPIKLDKDEVEWIKLIKGHYNWKYGKYYTYWTEVLKHMFNDVYGWNADEHPRDFLGCMFQKLLDIYIKIQYDCSGSNQQLKLIIGAGFEKTFTNNQELPIERVISQLCVQILNNQVVVDGVNRYYL